MYHFHQLSYDPWFHQPISYEIDHNIHIYVKCNDDAYMFGFLSVLCSGCNTERGWSHYIWRAPLAQLHEDVNS